MFQKLDDEVREMKTFMAEVVHKDDIGDAESLGGDDESLAEDEEDEEDVPDRSGDREAEGVGSADPDAARTRALNGKGSDKKRRSLEKRRDEEAEDAPLPVVEAGSEAAKRAAKRVSEGGGRPRVGFLRALDRLRPRRLLVDGAGARRRGGVGVGVGVVAAVGAGDERRARFGPRRGRRRGRHRGGRGRRRVLRVRAELRRRGGGGGVVREGVRV